MNMRNKYALFLPHCIIYTRRSDLTLTRSGRRGAPWCVGLPQRHNHTHFNRLGRNGSWRALSTLCSHSDASY